MDLQSISAVWSHVFHVTAAANVPSIRRSRVLWPAKTLLEMADRPELVRQRRTENLSVEIESHEVLLRNQIPLNPDLLDLGNAHTLEEYVMCLNSYVFFWPGNADGPRDDALRMFERTNALGAVSLRVPTHSLLERIGALATYVTTCNTGVTWTEQGTKARRGPEVFQNLETFSTNPSLIQEICFQSEVFLPSNTEWSCAPGGPWTAL